MEQINFQPVFDYIDKNNSILKEDIMVEVRSGISGIKTAVADLASDVKSLREEVKSSHHRHDKTESWINKAAPAIGIPFDQ